MMARMFDLAPQLASALRKSAEQLQSTAMTAARAETNAGAPVSNQAMASLAREAIFTETLLSAIRSRLQEIRLVTK